MSSQSVRFVGVVILAVLLAGVADAAEPEIWGRAIMPQPFEKEPFREVAAVTPAVDAVTLQPEGKELPMTTAGRETVVVAPRLDAHSIVVVELK